MNTLTLTSEDYRWAALVVEEHALEEDDSGLLYVARKLFAEHERLDALEAEGLAMPTPENAWDLAKTMAERVEARRDVLALTRRVRELEAANAEAHDARRAAERQLMEAHDARCLAEAALAERDRGMAGPSKDDLIALLSQENGALRHAGCNLAEAALRVIRDYDGIHRLALAVAEWTTAVANEGGRSAAEARDREATK